MSEMVHGFLFAVGLYALAAVGLTLAVRSNPNARCRWCGHERPYHASNCHPNPKQEVNP